MDAKADADKVVAIADARIDRNGTDGWFKIASKAFNSNGVVLKFQWIVSALGSSDNSQNVTFFLNLTIGFGSSGSNPYIGRFETSPIKKGSIGCYFKAIVNGTVGNATIELWAKVGSRYGSVAIRELQAGNFRGADAKGFLTYASYSPSDAGSSEEPTGNVSKKLTFVYVQEVIASPTKDNLVAMDANGLVKDSGLAKSSVESAISKAGSAIQGVNVNGTTLTPDANKIVNVPLATYSFADGYNASTNKGATVATVANAINALDVSSVGGDGKYISAISETDGKISATATSLATAPVSGSAVAITAGGVYTALAAKQNAIPDAGSAAKPVHFKDGKAVAGDSINNCKLTLKVGDATVGDGFTANAGTDFEYKVTGEQIASALTAGSGIAISGNTVSTNLPLSKDNAVNVNKNVWYIFAMTSIPSGGLYERCWDFLIASNHNSAAQMRLFISPRISASGNFESDSVIQADGHVTPEQLEKYKLATVKDSSGNLYCCLCVKHSHSNENRTVQWNLRDARGPSWLSKSTPLSNYTVVSERLFSNPVSSNRLVCYKQTNNAAVGNATQPVYVDANGRIQACSSMPKFVIGTPAGAADTIYFT